MIHIILYLLGVFGLIIDLIYFGVESLQKVGICIAIAPLIWGNSFELHHLKANVGNRFRVDVETFLNRVGNSLGISNEELVSHRWPNVTQIFPDIRCQCDSKSLLFDLRRKMY